MPRPLTRHDRARLTDLVEQIRHHGAAADASTQTKILDSHGFLNSTQNVRVFLNRINDSWRVYPEAISHVIQRNKDVFIHPNPRLFKTDAPVPNEAQYWVRTLSISHWYQSDPWVSDRRLQTYHNVRRHLATEGFRMLRAGQLWPNGVDNLLRERTMDINATDYTYMIYDRKLVRHCKETINAPNFFTKKPTLDHYQNLLNSIPAAKAAIMREYWLPEFLTKRELAQIPFDDINNDYLLRLYPTIAFEGAERYYHRMSTRRRRALDLGD